MFFVQYLWLGQIKKQHPKIIGSLLLILLQERPVHYHLEDGETQHIQWKNYLEKKMQ